MISRDAGWSSLVARRAHNPKVAGSNPAPATERARWKRRAFSCSATSGYAATRTAHARLEKGRRFQQYDANDYRHHRPVSPSRVRELGLEVAVVRDFCNDLEELVDAGVLSLDI